MFNKIMKSIGGMNSLKFWKKMVIAQGKHFLITTLRDKIDELIIEYLIRRPMEASMRIRKKNGWPIPEYGKDDMRDFMDIRNSVRAEFGK